MHALMHIVCTAHSSPCRKKCISSFKMVQRHYYYGKSKYFYVRNKKSANIRNQLTNAGRLVNIDMCQSCIVSQNESQGTVKSMTFEDPLQKRHLQKAGFYSISPHQWTVMQHKYPQNECIIKIITSRAKKITSGVASKRTSKIAQLVERLSIDLTPGSRPGVGKFFF